MELFDEHCQRCEKRFLCMTSKVKRTFYIVRTEKRKTTSQIVISRGEYGQNGYIFRKDADIDAAGMNLHYRQYKYDVKEAMCADQLGYPIVVNYVKTRLPFTGEYGDLEWQN